MNNNIKALVAKAWKNESADLQPGTHFIDEEIVLRVTGTVEKRVDEFAAPTVSIPLISALALFWEKSGVTRDKALAMLREALHEAMEMNVKEDRHIAGRIKDVENAISTIRQELIAKLPPMRREGKVIVENLNVEVMPVGDLVGAETLMAA